jgi:hypothetical protein
LTKYRERAVRLAEDYKLGAGKVSYAKRSAVLLALRDCRVEDNELLDAPSNLSNFEFAKRLATKTLNLTKAQFEDIVQTAFNLDSEMLRALLESAEKKVREQ